MGGGWRLPQLLEGRLALPVRVGLGDGSECLVKRRGAQPAPGPAKRNGALECCDATARWDRLPPTQPPSEPGCLCPLSPRPHPPRLPEALWPLHKQFPSLVSTACLFLAPGHPEPAGCLPDSTDACGSPSQLTFLPLAPPISLPATFPPLCAQHRTGLANSDAQ